MLEPRIVGSRSAKRAPSNVLPSDKSATIAGRYPHRNGADRRRLPPTLYTQCSATRIDSGGAARRFYSGVTSTGTTCSTSTAHRTVRCIRVTTQPPCQACLAKRIILPDVGGAYTHGPRFRTVQKKVQTFFRDNSFGIIHEGCFCPSVKPSARL
jgi:hypothetical protein